MLSVPAPAVRLGLSSMSWFAEPVASRGVAEIRFTVKNVGGSFLVQELPVYVP